MITTRQAPTQRLLVGAFALSVLIHLFGGALWAHTSHLIARIMQRLPEQHAREQQIATADVIHLERRVVPRPAQASRVRPAVRPEGASSKPIEPAAAARPEIAHLTAHAPQHSSNPDYASATATRSHSPIAHKAALSAAQLAQLNAQFAHTIAASHVDLATIQKRTEERPVATKRYPLQFTGMQANLERGEGYIEPTTSGRRIGGTVWYYTHYTYMWPDGHLEDDDIPWPFRYPIQRDLFALHIHLIPVQLPPPGFHLTRPLKPFLAHFLQTAGHG